MSSIDMTGLKFILPSKMGVNCSKNPFILAWFTTGGVLQNGSILKSWTHTSGHFDIGVANGSENGSEKH